MAPSPGVLLALALSLAPPAARAGDLAPQAARAGDWELKVCADPDNLPFSNRAGEGFDNRIAAILAEELRADLTWVWLPDLRGRSRQRLVQAGDCDMVMGVMDGQPGFLTSYAYYRTGYVFLYPEDAPFEVASLDDPVLRDLRIGVPGGVSKLVPPGVALANRGIVANQIHFNERRGEPEVPVLTGLAEGKVDLAIAWGPQAGAYARRVGGLTMTPVTPQIDPPFIPMFASIAIGFRPEDEGLRDTIDAALARSWDRTRAVLTEAGVPLIDLPAPAPAPGSRG